MSRRAWIAIGAALGGAALFVVAAYLGAVWWTASRVPLGTTVAGVAIGGMDRADAYDDIAAWADDAQSAPIEVTVLDGQTSVVPDAVGLTIDVDAMWSAVPTGGWAIADLVDWFTAEPAIAAVHTVDEEALDAWVGELADDVDIAPREPTLAFEGTTPVLTRGEDGRTLDQDALREGLVAAFLGHDETVVATVALTPPTVSTEAAEASASAAQVLLAAPPTVQSGEATAAVPRPLLSRVVTFEPRDGTLAAVVDGTRMRDRLVRQNPDLATPGRDARFVIRQGAPKVVPSQDGSTVSAADLGDQVAAAFAQYPAGGTLTVAQEPLAPDLTTEEAEGLGITERLSRFTQNYPYAAYRVQNLGQAAEYINGTIVMPGEVYSHNATLKERTVENGYTEGYVIGPGGVFQMDLGGGVSASATATWTAAFFAGMEREQVRAHSIYISRYQPGLEATVAWGIFDMSFRNPYENAVLITAKTTPTSLTVTFWGTREYDDIEAEFGPRTNIRPHGTIVSTAPGCESQSGMDGFDINVDRVFYKDGVEVRRETISTSYRPSPTVVCRQPEPERPDRPNRPNRPNAQDGQGTADQQDATTPGTAPGATSDRIRAARPFAASPTARTR
jgi:vancomycin resistance protein YoaR